VEGLPHDQPGFNERIVGQEVCERLAGAATHVRPDLQARRPAAFGVDEGTCIANRAVPIHVQVAHFIHP
jgi:hypothetical protein